MIHTTNGKKRSQDNWANHIDNAIFDLMNGSLPEMLHKNLVQTKPLANILKQENSFVIEMAVPGLAKEQININVVKDQLVISAEVDKELAEDERYTKNEFSYNKFERKFNLGETIDMTNIQAKCENGVLKITLNVKEKEDTTIKVDIQ